MFHEAYCCTISWECSIFSSSDNLYGSSKSAATCKNLIFSLTHDFSNVSLRFRMTFCTIIGVTRGKMTVFYPWNKEKRILLTLVWLKVQKLLFSWPYVRYKNASKPRKEQCFFIPSAFFTLRFTLYPGPKNVVKIEAITAHLFFAIVACSREKWKRQ